MPVTELCRLLWIWHTVVLILYIFVTKLKDFPYGVWIIFKLLNKDEYTWCVLTPYWKHYSLACRGNLRGWKGRGETARMPPQQEADTATLYVMVIGWKGAGVHPTLTSQGLFFHHDGMYGTPEIGNRHHRAGYRSSLFATLWVLWGGNSTA